MAALDTVRNKAKPLCQEVSGIKTEIQGFGGLLEPVQLVHACCTTNSGSGTYSNNALKHDLLHQDFILQIITLLIKERKRQKKNYSSIY